MYLKKASLDQRPSNMMVNTGKWAKYIAIAAPLLAEWRPISFAENPKESGPTAVAASLSFLRSSEPEKKVNFPLGSWNLFIYIYKQMIILIALAIYWQTTPTAKKLQYPALRLGG